MKYRSRMFKSRARLVNGLRAKIAAPEKENPTICASLRGGLDVRPNRKKSISASLISPRVTKPDIYSRFNLATSAVTNYLILLALPTEERELSKLNSLHKGLGQKPFIEIHRVSASTPKPFCCSALTS